jgi:alanine dehydrogenase
MLIGVPKEIKPDEYLVALTPLGTEALTSAGHQVLIEDAAGMGSGFTDDSYSMAGAEILDSADAIWVRAALVMKVKEPIKAEWPKIREGQVLFTYFHLASSLEPTEALLASRAVAIAYEIVELLDRELP